jgi:nucleotide sugar dehydrogenase
VNWLTPTKIRELSITGERGMYLVNYLTQDVFFYENDYTTTNWDALRPFVGVSEGTMTRLKVQKAEPLRLEYENVITSLRNDVVPTVSGEDGIAALKVVRQLTESAYAVEGVRQTAKVGGRCKMQNDLLDFPLWSSTVAVVGMGKIGLPLAVQYARHGHRVIGCDIDPLIVETINAGHSHVQEEPELALELARAVDKRLLSATGHTTEAVRQAGIVVAIVPVAVDVKHEVNFEAIDAATAAIGAGLQPGTLVIFETTLPVGTTSQRLRKILERTANLKVGHDFYLAYSPERVSSGYIFRDLCTYPKVVGGIDEQSTTAAVAFYRSVLDAEIIPMASTNEAEFVKLIETTYRDVNIALANEYARFADAYGLDVAASIAAANTQPYSRIHAPGVGVGGHCIPVYPYFLLAGVAELGFHTPHAEPPMMMLPSAARIINDAMAEYAVKRIEAVMGSLVHQPVLILGVSYRGNVREAAFTSAKLLQNALLKCEATVYVDDPLFKERELEELGYTILTTERESEIQAIILQADHFIYQSLDFSRFPHCQVVLDGRKALRRENIELLGMHYIAIGDGNYEKPEIM